MEANKKTNWYFQFKSKKAMRVVQLGWSVPLAIFLALHAPRPASVLSFVGLFCLYYLSLLTISHFLFSEDRTKFKNETSTNIQ